MTGTNDPGGSKASGSSTILMSRIEEEAEIGLGCEADTSRVIFGTTHSLPKESTTTLPPDFVAAFGKDLNGDFGLRKNAGHEDMWYTFKIKTIIGPHKDDYKWDQITVFSRRKQGSNTGVILCLGLQASETNEPEVQLDGGKTLLPTLHVRLLRNIWHLYDKSVWSLRDRLRAAEKAREASVDFIYLHELARHFFHSNETLDVAIKTFDAIQKMFKVSVNDTEKQYFDEQTFALSLKFHALKSRSESLRERLQNEINLGFNLAAQEDTVAMLELGRNYRDDSRNMKAIALVGLVYLPGTFVSGLFGMNFFSFSDDKGQQTWSVSHDLWLYWLVVIPLTLATVVTWLVALRVASKSTKTRS